MKIEWPYIIPDVTLLPEPDNKVMSVIFSTVSVISTTTTTTTTTPMGV